MAHLVGIDGREFLVDRLAGCSIPFTESTLTALATNFKIQAHRKHEKIAARKTHHEIHSSVAITTTSRRRATKHVPRVSTYLSTSIYTRFVKIGLVQLSQPLTNTNDTHTRTDRLIQQWHPVRIPVWEAFLAFGKNGLGRFAPSDFPATIFSGVCVQFPTE